MAWIFQGNPEVFKIDEYLAHYPMLIYWRVPQYPSRVMVGDRAFIWRAGPESGVVASGRVVEAPVKKSEVAHPEALNNDLWVVAPVADNDELKVGIALDSIRLSAAEGMVLRSVVKNDPLLKKNKIIRMANETVFFLDEHELKRIEELWGSAYEPEPEPSNASATEGQSHLRAHRRRERSRFLVKKKLEEFRRLHGSLHCEVCAVAEVGGPYPPAFAARIFEVHHTSPLSRASTPCQTTLTDLAVLCANCHSAVHATADVENNMKAIRCCYPGQQKDESGS